ncbi:restriction endonuclease subunit S [Marinobacter sp. ELB17]|uniref:restriction endonuclease subunit S n=1 Tax=Marinobacter sp. ELB17 TaxID=270374 RepID=UPI0000F36EF6|nr:restriction endonuclease subunit S [Marinobacter sp. ELB17]EBA01753.1 type I restriction-modification [Marinobacter sp. ELB17]
MSFPRYSEYKDTEINWIAQIPTGWQIASLSKLFSIKAGGDVNTDVFSETRTHDRPFPIYTNANNPNIVYGYTSKAKYGPNCITVSGRGYVGFAAFRDHIFDAIIRLLVLTPKKDLNCKFFEYFINEVVDFREESSAIGQLSTNQIAPYKVAFPDCREQSKITHFLDHETAKIDTLIHEQKRLIELLKEKRQAVISHAVTKGLDPDVPIKDSGVEWLGDVPAHWGVATIRRFAKAVRTGGTPSLEMPNSEIADGINWFTPGDFNGSLMLHESEKQLRISSISSGDAKLFPGGSVLVVGIGATLGKVAKVDDDFSANQQINVIVPGKRINGHFLVYSLSAQKSQMRFVSNASTIGIMNQEKTKDIVLVLPPVEEQTQITESLDRGVQNLDQLVIKAASGILLLKERRSALISAAVTGKIDVRDWQPPADESTFDKEMRQAEIKVTA